MSNHSGEIDPEMEKKLHEMFEQVVGKTHKESLREAAHQVAEEHELGATGQHPEGKLTEQDEGELKLAIAAVDGKAVMSFGTPVAWVGLLPSQADAIADALKAKAQEAREQIAAIAAALENKETPG